MKEAKERSAATNEKTAIVTLDEKDDATMVEEKNARQDKEHATSFVRDHEPPSSQNFSPYYCPSAKQPYAVDQIDLPRFCSRYRVPSSHCTAFTISDFLSAAECNKLIHFASPRFKYISEATHIAPDGSAYRVPIQNPNPHKLSVLDHPLAINSIWERLQPIIRPHIQSHQLRTRCGEAVGINPRIRILRYDATDSDRFDPHFDATTYIDAYQSLLTVLIYLNNGGGVEFEGGETCYLDAHISAQGVAMEKTCARTPASARLDDQDPESVLFQSSITKVTPEIGKVVVFEHDLYHSGAPLTWGTKYVLRTDILFQRKLDDSTGGIDEKGEHIAIGDAKTDGSGSYDEVSSSKKRPNLMIDLCLSLRVSEEDISLLDLLCVLDMTIPSFFGLGITPARKVLRESGLEQETVDKLISAGVEVLQQS